jgi:hypothetical protein
MKDFFMKRFIVSPVTRILACLKRHAGVGEQFNIAKHNPKLIPGAAQILIHLIPVNTWQPL